MKRLKYIMPLFIESVTSSSLMGLEEVRAQVFSSFPEALFGRRARKGLGAGGAFGRPRIKFLALPCIMQGL